MADATTIALVQRLGSAWPGPSSRIARLTVVPAAWCIIAAQDLGDGHWALTLVRGREDATAVVWFHPRLDKLCVSDCTDDGAWDWLLTGDGEHAAYRAIYLGRYDAEDVL